MDLQDIVAINKNEKCSYPSKNSLFNPSQMYPEYLWGEKQISIEENFIYDGVRNVLLELGLDKEHANSASWNPLSELIKEGDTVLIKPNMVLDKHHGDESIGLECVVTHPSVVRAVTDYVYIALKGTGKIIIGDAPVQACNFENLIENYGYQEILEFYQERYSNIELLDFRLVKSAFKNNIISKVEKDTDGMDAYTSVDLAKESMLYEIIEKHEAFRVTNYDPSQMREHHNLEKNEYLIPNIVLQADVIINLPKPKTHRKAGMTGALKNLVGINGNKDWLPHHTKGSKQEGGDEYELKSGLKSKVVNLQEQVDVSAIQGKTNYSKLINYKRKAVKLLALAAQKDSYWEGSWFGNDTIWRTICDLNRIILYADKFGKMKSEKQRTYFALGDMVISGEAEGPLEPNPKKLGIILASLNPIAFDVITSSIMGFDYKKIPSIHNSNNANTYKIINNDLNCIEVKSNVMEWNHLNVNEFRKLDHDTFVPTSGWKNHIEL